MPTKIEWAEMTWNPVTGCTKVSEGCLHCYAERVAKRFAGRGGYPKDDPFAVTLHHDRLREPIHWRKPRVIFVCSMSDLFHEDVPTSFIYEVFDTMLQCPQHTFLLLTKRSQRMKSLMNGGVCGRERYGREHIWPGVSVENQAATNRIDDLLAIDSARRFISCGPLLGPLDLRPYLRTMQQDADGNMEPAIQWVIVEGESGPGARMMEPEWAYDILSQTEAEGACPFFKQTGIALAKKWGCIDKKGSIIDGLPRGLQKRQRPTLLRPTIRGR